MSIRTLFEINHDFTSRLDDEFLDALRRYLSSGDSYTADHLRSYGLRIVSQRHHSSEFRIPKGTDGFAPTPSEAGEKP